ncbi:MAG: phosphodiester glycosidase family protein [Alphaproteobacteria bacterium]|nr:phosphodiester glycosidase family protein [Alphaproteobacteria bacterium]
MKPPTLIRWRVFPKRWKKLIKLANKLVACGVAFIALTTAAWAECKPLNYSGRSYTVCGFNPAREHIELFNLDENDIPLGNFRRLSAKLQADGKTLVFAMNAGMFDQNLRPVGLYIENGVEVKKLNRRSGSGNFHLKPNGVFYISGNKSGVMETEAFAKSGIKPDYATQSGPMLVVNGKIHPKLSPTGTSLKIRNGVGVLDDRSALFVISNEPVGFYEFASLFKDQLGTKNALFLDGSVSSLYNKDGPGVGGYVPLGPMVGVYTQP